MMLANSIWSQENSLYEKHMFIVKGDTLPYRLLKPQHTEAGKKYPLVLLLHGSGERGKDNEKQLVHIAPVFAKPENLANYPCYVLVPQCPESDSWILNGLTPELKQVKDTWQRKASKPIQLVQKLIDQLEKEEAIDGKRLYITGLSLGGYGTFDLLTRDPKRFAAAIPICGGGDLCKARRFRKVPIWIFHGDADAVINVELSRKMVAKLKDKGSPVRYTEYPGVNHDSWTPAYLEPELLPWMFSQARK